MRLLIKVNDYDYHECVYKKKRFIKIIKVRKLLASTIFASTIIYIYLVMYSWK